MASEVLETTIGEVLSQHGGSVKTGPFGTTLKAKEYSTDGVPLISVGEIGYGAIRVHPGTPRVPREVVERLPEYLLEHRDIVFGRKGAVDRSAMVKPGQAGWFLGSDGIRLRLPKSCDAQFVAYHLQAPATRTWLVQHATGTTMASLNQGTIERIPVRLPPLPEQRAISRILGTLDDKIELNRRMNETLEAMARALFKSWFVDFDPVRAKAEGRDPGLPPALADLFPSEFEESELGEIPKGWRVGAVAEVAKVTSGKRPGGKADMQSDKYSIPVFGGGGVLGYTDIALYDVPIITTGRVGTLGNVFLVQEPSWPSDNALVVVADNEVLPIVYFTLLRADLDVLNRGSTQPLLTQSDLRVTATMLPSSAVVANFARVFWLLWARRSQDFLESRTLAALRDTLLPKLISGELRVPDAERLVGAAR